MTDLLNRGLPKWPQMLVTGVPVPDRAKEIIRCTDSFFTHGYDGNDHDWNRAVRKALGMPEEYDQGKGAYDSNRFHAYWEELRVWRERWGAIETQYVHNSWVSCSFVYGAHGWCHPDGRIGFIDNVGKWPSVEEIREDWSMLASAFPFLDLGVTLMSGESCEESTNPIVSMRVRNGSVQLIDPEKEDVHVGHPLAGEIVGTRPILGNEIGVPQGWINDWAKARRDESGSVDLLQALVERSGGHDR